MSRPFLPCVAHPPDPAAAPSRPPVGARKHHLLWPEGAPGKLGDRPQDRPTVTPTAGAGGAQRRLNADLPGGGYAHLARTRARVTPSGSSNRASRVMSGISRGPQRLPHPAMLQDAAAVCAWCAPSPAATGSTRRASASSARRRRAPRRHPAHAFRRRGPTGSRSDRTRKLAADLGILCYPVITMGDATMAVRARICSATIRRPIWSLSSRTRNRSPRRLRLFHLDHFGGQDRAAGKQPDVRRRAASRRRAIRSAHL